MKRSSAFLFAAAALLVANPIFAQSIREIPFESQPDLLSMPDDIYLGEALGVATNSQGHLYVFTRSGSSDVTLGTNRFFRRSSSRLFEFDGNGRRSWVSSVWPAACWESSPRLTRSTVGTRTSFTWVRSSAGECRSSRYSPEFGLA